MNAPAAQDRGPHAARGRGRRIGLLVFISILVAMGGAEVVYRAAGMEPRRYAPRRFDSATGGVPYETIPTREDPRYFAYRAGSVFASVYDPLGCKRGYPARVEYRIDEQRMRTHAPVSAAAGRARVLCLGDSFTFGEGVIEADTYPAKLEKLLHVEGTDVRVFNGGVQGYGTRQELVFFERFGRALKPGVVTLAFVLNDACDVAETIAQNDAMTRAFEPSTLGGISAIWRTIERRRHESQLQSAFFRQIRGGFNSVEWDHCRAALDRFHALSDEDGFAFLVVIFPIFWQLDGGYPFDDLHAKVAQACRDAKCEYIDLRDQFRDRPSESFWVHPTDQHPNEIAHDRAARAIAPRIAEMLKNRGSTPAP